MLLPRQKQQDQPATVVTLDRAAASFLLQAEAEKMSKKADPETLTPRLNVILSTLTILLK